MFWARKEKSVLNSSVRVMFPAWKSTVLHCLYCAFMDSTSFEHVHFWPSKNLNHLILWPWWISYFGWSMKIEMPSYYCMHLQLIMHSYHWTNRTRPRTNSTVAKSSNFKEYFLGDFWYISSLVKLFNPSLRLAWEDLGPLGAGGCCKVFHKHHYWVLGLDRLVSN